VRADEKLTAFLELELAIRAAVYQNQDNLSRRAMGLVKPSRAERCGGATHDHAHE
jgi:hypothetical protein